MTLKTLLYAGFATGLALVLSAPAAMATEAAATVDLNVRTGPGTNFSVVDTLNAGERVEVVECQPNAWCYIDQSGANGWVSSNYLEAVPAPGGGGSNCQLQFTIGADGPKLAVVCDDPAPVPAPAPSSGLACFYGDANFSGARFCANAGDMPTIIAGLNNRITSVRLTGATRVRLCTEPNHGGFCLMLTGDVPQLGPIMNNRASSLTVYSPWWGGGLPVPFPAPVPAPVPIPIPTPVTPATPATFSTGPLELASSYTADLDRGIMAGGGVDIWHHAINAAVRKLEPRNGAKLALGDGSNRGFAGCYNAAFSSASIPFASLTIGTYVCAKTSEGRISQFRVNGYNGTTLRIGYTTWSD